MSSRRTIALALAAVALLLAGMSLAATPTPAGLWRTIDDETHKERSLVRITEVNGELRGAVEKIFDQPGDDPSHICKECKGDRKDKPIVGMTILWGLRRDGDEWTGGEILDPKNGKTYRCKMKLSPDGKSLDVRGYVGLSLLGRTQTWLRAQ